MNKKQIMTILNNNGIDENYLGPDMELELGTEEWMGVVEELTGKNPFDDNALTDEDHAKIQDFMDKLEELGIRTF
jgi:hypothetical protein